MGAIIVFRTVCRGGGLAALRDASVDCVALGIFCWLEQRSVLSIEMFSVIYRGCTLFVCPVPPNCVLILRPVPLHRALVMRRDLKPENVLIHEVRRCTL